MSLTTAVSDEDDGESVMASPYKAKATGTAAASFNCTGAVRKAGYGFHNIVSFPFVLSNISFDSRFFFQLQFMLTIYYTSQIQFIS